MSATLDHDAGSRRRPGARRHGTGGVTITELAASLKTTVRALRYYEEVFVLQPDRTRGNARFYSPETRARAEIIVTLRNCGVPLKAIESALGPANAQKLAGLEALCSLCREQVRERLVAVDALEALVRSLRTTKEPGLI